jgi:hypothetical protein
MISDLLVYFKFISIYRGIIDMDLEMFHEFMDPSNIVVQLLIAHFFALQLVVAPIINREWAGRKRSTPLRFRLDQIYQLSKGIPDSYKSHLAWPLAIADAVMDEVAGNKPLVPRVPILRNKEWADPASAVLGWS